MDTKRPQDSSSLSVPSRTGSPSSRPLDREAATQAMRQQINQLYDNTSNDLQPPDTQHLYHRTHSEDTDHAAARATADQWKHYHTQWQNYYQQYYERYYLTQLAARQNQLGGHQIAPTPSATPSLNEPEELTKPEAVSELRDQLLNKVREHTQKVRRSRHFVPVIAALIVAMTFGFLQYNSLIFAQIRSYISPGSINPANLIVDPTTDTKVSPEPKIIIPKINVEAPVVYDVPSLDESLIQSKLKSGVVHYPIPGANGFPGQKGNTVILGHSSNDVFDDGNYKFVFVQLNNLEKGDTFYLNYQGTRYTYSVTDKKVIDPKQVNELVINSGKPLATLVTCTPPGTALKRLVVIGEQISPDPDNAAAAQPSGNTNTGNVTIPGNSPTLFERLFGGN